MNAAVMGVARDWHEVVHIDEVSNGRLAGRRVAGCFVLVLKVGEQVLAYEDMCPHAGWPLRWGTLKGTELTCANHGWTFDVTDGGCVSRPEHRGLVAYPCTVREDGMILFSPERSE